jgi:hypothetical protein
VHVLYFALLWKSRAQEWTDLLLLHMLVKLFMAMSPSRIFEFLHSFFFFLIRRGLYLGSGAVSVVV